MALTTEWRERIDHWRKELRLHHFSSIGELTLSGFTTAEQLPVKKAARGRFKPVAPGSQWGKPWDYGWFKAELTIPREGKGRRLVLAWPGEDEAVIFINGKAAGARNWAHQYPTLALKAKPGERLRLLFEVYAGHGPHPVDGPIPPERRSSWVPPPFMKTVPQIGFGLWEEEAFQLSVDLDTLVSLRDRFDPASLRVAAIDDCLRAAVMAIDFEVTYPERLAGFRRARAILAPALACHNGSTMPDFFCFGHGHIDTAWLWPIAESRRKIARTVSEQLNLAKEYPGYRFLMSQPAQYAMMKADYPELYSRVRKAVASGAIIADGGMWVEADTNLPSGESLIRQLIHGKRFFREEFGIDSRVMWLPDVFGYSAAVPQIMKGCGIDYFSTAKILWTYHGGEPFPYHNFIWEGIDGSEVIAHFHENYNSATEPGEMIARWQGRRQANDMTCRMIPFGHGDGGGGPTRTHLEFLVRQQDLEGAPRCHFSAPQAFFKELVRRGEHDRNRYVGELYYPCHRGTYTTQARTKAGNRRGEVALRDAELWSAITSSTLGRPYPARALDGAWKLLLLNQFHDILPGSSINRVYKEAEANLGAVAFVAETLTAAALTELAKTKAGECAVFNSLGWERTALVPRPKGVRANKDMPTQKHVGKTYCLATIPACGATTLTGAASSVRGLGVEPSALFVVKGPALTRLENDLLRVEFNRHGEITRIHDKETGIEFLSGLGNRFKLFKDVPTSYEAWDILSFYEEEPVAITAPTTTEITATGPLFAAICVTRRISDASTVSQEIRLTRGSRRLDFITTVDWKERHRLLKVGFDVNVHADEAIHEIQFGYLKRPTHRSRQLDRDRFEVSQHKWSALAEEKRGVAILNDCKYGINVLGNTMNLTLLRSPCTPDPEADRGQHRFTYSLLCWNGSFAESRVVQEAYELNVPVRVFPGAAPHGSWFSVDQENVIIDTVKLAEDGSGDVIVRLYESMRSATRCTLTTTLPLSDCRVTDMLETPQGQVALKQGRVELSLRAFEVQTLRFKVGSKK